MPSCVVKSCKNNSGLVNKQHGITFHKFPLDDLLRKDWTRIIRRSRKENGWNPSKSSVICCLHFDKNDMYITKCGRQRVLNYAVPKKFLLEPPSSQEKHESKAVVSSAPHEVDSNTLEISSSTEGVERHQQTLEQCLSQNLNSDLLESPSVQEKQAYEADMLCFSHNIYQSDLLESSSTIEATSEHQHRLEQACSQNPDSYLTQSSPRDESPRGEMDMEHTLSLLYSTRELRMKKNLIKMQMLTQKQKKKIKLLNQQVKRLQNRNKRLKALLKNLVR